MSDEAEGGGARQGRRRLQVLVGAIALVVVGAALHVTRSVTLPFAFALFLALLLRPVQRWTSAHVHRRLRWLGVVVAMLLMLAAVAVLGGVVVLAVLQAKDEGPRLVETLRGHLERLPFGAGQGGGLKEQAPKLGARLASVASDVVAEGVLILFFTLLMLIEAPQWRDRVRRVLAADKAGPLLDTVGEVGRSVRHYLVAVSLVALISGVSQGAFLAVMGVKLALLWGVLVFALSYVPVIGSIVAAVPPVLFALLTQGLARGALVAGGMFLLEQVTGNLIGPYIEGKGMKLPALIVLLSVTFWSFLWGPIGALLAVPLTVAVLAACARVPVLRPVAALLGHEGAQGGAQGKARAAIRR